MKIKILSLPKHNFADGGDTGNGVTTFSGLKHGQFGLDGIPQGIASDGLPNYVQGGGFDKNGNPIKGEVKYKDYIYGELKITKKLADKFNLPEKWIGLKYQEAADIAQQESKDRPNDPISLTTLDEWMTRLQGAQEEQKYIRDTREAAKVVDNMSDEEKAALMSSLAQPMTQQEGIDLSQPVYAKGGKIYIKPENRGKFTALKKRTGKSASWFKAHGTPAQKKMATFALNAKKWKHENGGHLYQKGGYYPWEVGYLYDNKILPYSLPEITIAVPSDEVARQNADLALAVGKALGKKNLGISVGDYKTQLKPGFNTPLLEKDSKSPLGVKVASKSPTTTKDDTVTIDNIDGFNGSMLRYAPAVGAGLGAITAALQPKDYALAEEIRDAASQLNPIGAPHIGGYRKYIPYDVNLGDAENIALTARALEANRGQNRATQGALNAAVVANAQKTAAARNLTAQQANEANRLAVDTYNLGIDQFNAQRDTQYDQLNQQILQNKLNMLMSAAQAEDNSRTAWVQNINSTTENFFNQLGNVGKDEWNKGQLLYWLKEHPATAKALGIEIG